MTIRSIRVFLLFILSWFVLELERNYALELIVLNDIPEMVKTKKIILRVTPSQHEKILYREMFRFSTNTDKIRLLLWKSSVAAKTEYIAPFHQPKRVFTGPFELEFTYECRNISDDDLPVVLAQTSLAISYVSLNENQKHRAQTSVVSISGPLDDQDLRGNFKYHLSGDLLFDQTVSSSLDESISGIQFQQLPEFDEEAAYLKKLEFLYEQFCLFCLNVTMQWGVLFILIVFVFFAALLGIWLMCIKYPEVLKYYPVIAARGIFILLPIAISGLFGFCGELGIGFILLGIYSFLLGCYLLVMHAGNLSFSSKLITLIGCCAVIVSLPFFLKGLLILWL